MALAVRYRDVSFSVHCLFGQWCTLLRIIILGGACNILVNGAIIATGTVQMIKNDPLVKSAYLGEELDAH